MDITIERKYTVYMHTSPSGKRYVGITSQDVARRWRNGGIGYKTCLYFWNAIKKHGWDNITHEVLAEGLTIHDATLMEIELIKQFDLTNPEIGYNLSIGGEKGALGCIRSTTTRAKISAASKGRVTSEETKQKLSTAGMGKIHSEETKQKMSAAQKGHHRRLGCKNTAETRAKLSAANKGKNKGKIATPETRAKISAAAMGNQHNLGHKHTDATRAAMSAARMGNQYTLGYKHTAATRAKMSAAHKGIPKPAKPKSAESR